MIITLDLIIFAGGIIALILVVIWRLLIALDGKEMFTEKGWYTWPLYFFFPPFKLIGHPSKPAHRLGLTQWLLVIIVVSSFLHALLAY